MRVSSVNTYNKAQSFRGAGQATIEQLSPYQRRQLVDQQISDNAKAASRQIRVAVIENRKGFFANLRRAASAVAAAVV